DDLEELYTRYGIVSRAGYRLSPLAEAMIEQIKGIDAVDEEVCSLENFAV
ncbi:LysR family transcriptional regulator, partial [Pseudomonas sp. HMWF021]